MTRNGLYGLSAAGCVAGYVWLTCFESYGQSVCLFHRLFHVPCPSCGSTRAVAALLRGDVREAFLTNPIGPLLAGLLVALPLWIVVDVVTGEDSYYRAFCRMDEWLGRRYVFLLLVLMIVANWIWNIVKEL